MAAATTAAEPLDAGAVEGASDESPIAITATAHGLSDGTYITVEGVDGNDAANGSFPVTRIDDDHFSLDGSTGDGDWTAGGIWSVAGLYRYAVAATSAAGFEVGTAYTALIQGQVSGLPTADTQVFIVT